MATVTTIHHTGTTPIGFAQAIHRRGLGGAVALVLSLLSCYGTLAALGALSALGMTLSLNEVLWASTIFFFALLTAVIVVTGRRRHRRWPPAVVAITGVLLVGYVMWVRFDRLIELAGFVLLAVAVFWDWQCARGHRYHNAQ